MALPPEQINIKRRREEEPVETLCTESPFSPLFLPHDLEPSNMVLSTFFRSLNRYICLLTDVSTVSPLTSQWPCVLDSN
jgi:hypothetical protein